MISLDHDPEAQKVAEHFGIAEEMVRFPVGLGLWMWKVIAVGILGCLAVACGSTTEPAIVPTAVEVDVEATVEARVRAELASAATVETATSRPAVLTVIPVPPTATPEPADMPAPGQIIVVGNDATAQAILATLTPTLTPVPIVDPRVEILREYGQAFSDAMERIEPAFMAAPLFPEDSVLPLHEQRDVADFSDSPPASVYWDVTDIRNLQTEWAEVATFGPLVEHHQLVSSYIANFLKAPNRIDEYRETEGRPQRATHVAFSYIKVHWWDWVNGPYEVIFDQYWLAYDLASDLVFPEGEPPGFMDAFSGATGEISDVDPVGEPLEIIDVDFKVTEQNSSWWRYAWKLTVKNNESTVITFDAEIKWLDADGFIIDTSEDYNLTIPPGEEHTFTGADLIRQPGASNIKSLEVAVGQ